jgi:hypothetical protein
MTRAILAVLAVAFALLALATGCGLSPSRPEGAARPQAAPPLAIEVLTDADANEFEGCGCAFYPQGSQGTDSNPVVGWTDASIASARLRTDGTTQVLGPVVQREDPDRGPEGHPQVGDRATFLLGNDRTNATLACRVRETCWDDESCESIAYGCDLEVESGGRRGSRQVDGYCGC